MAVYLLSPIVGKIIEDCIVGIHDMLLDHNSVPYQLLTSHYNMQAGEFESPLSVPFTLLPSFTQIRELYLYSDSTLGSNTAHYLSGRISP